MSDPSVMEALHVTDANMASWPGTSIRYSRTAANLLVSPGYPDLVEQVRVLIYRWARVGGGVLTEPVNVVSLFLSQTKCVNS